MKNLLNKIAALLFLLTGFIPIFFTLFFLIRQQSIRHEMKERLEEELLCNISLPEAEVIWVKPKKEILIDGKMFDVKSFTVENGKYHFNGLFDDEETALNNYLESHTSQKNEKDNRVLMSLFQLLQSVFSTEDEYTLTAKNGSGVYCGLILSDIQSPIQDIPTPPPQVELAVRIG